MEMFMVDHYALLYMGCILSIVHMNIFLCWLLRVELAGRGTEEGRASRHLGSCPFFKKKKSEKKINMQ